KAARECTFSDAAEKLVACEMEGQELTDVSTERYLQGWHVVVGAQDDLHALAKARLDRDAFLQEAAHPPLGGGQAGGQQDLPVVQDQHACEDTIQPTDKAGKDGAF